MNERRFTNKFNVCDEEGNQFTLSEYSEIIIEKVGGIKNKIVGYQEYLLDDGTKLTKFNEIDFQHIETGKWFRRC